MRHLLTNLNNEKNNVNGICIPNEQFIIFEYTIINKYNTLLVIISIILIFLILFIIKFIQLVKKNRILYSEDYDKTTITINHIV
jgi:hypothetical protein